MKVRIFKTKITKRINPPNCHFLPLYRSPNFNCTICRTFIPQISLRTKVSVLKIWILKVIIENQLSPAVYYRDNRKLESDRHRENVSRRNCGIPVASSLRDRLVNFRARIEWKPSGCQRNADFSRRQTRCHVQQNTVPPPRNDTSPSKHWLIVRHRLNGWFTGSLSSTIIHATFFVVQEEIARFIRSVSSKIASPFFALFLYYSVSFWTFEEGDSVRTCIKFEYIR